MISNHSYIMNTLAVIGYNDVFKAEEVRLSLINMQRDYLINLERRSGRGEGPVGHSRAQPSLLGVLTNFPNQQTSIEMKTRTFFT